MANGVDQPLNMAYDGTAVPATDNTSPVDTANAYLNSLINADGTGNAMIPTTPNVATGDVATPSPAAASDSIWSQLVGRVDNIMNAAQTKLVNQATVAANVEADKLLGTNLAKKTNSNVSASMLSGSMLMMLVVVGIVVALFWGKK